MTALDADAREALLELLRTLRAADYDFVVPTPETHRRVVGRPDKQQATGLRDMFGWNIPFSPGVVPAGILDLLLRADAVSEEEGGLYRSRYRVARLGDKLYLHSAFPTSEKDSVFFGPDSYRFAAFLRAELPRAARVSRLVDFGAGAGAGVLTAAAWLREARLSALDTNGRALELARINAKAAGVRLEAVEGSSLDDIDGPIDLVIANPPFILDRAQRAYRDGGDLHGARCTIDWAMEAAGRLSPSGRMLLYSGSAIVEGRDGLREALADGLASRGCSLRYRELDPDIFGDQLGQPGYEDVERIAAIGAVVTRP